MAARLKHDVAAWGMLFVSLGLLYHWSQLKTDPQRILWLMAAWTAWLWAMAFTVVMPIAHAWKTRDFAFFHARSKHAVLAACALVLVVLLLVEVMRDA